MSLILQRTFTCKHNAENSFHIPENTEERSLSSLLNKIACCWHIRHLPTPSLLDCLTRRFTWQMFTCITFRTSVSYLDWKSSQKDSVFAPFRSHSVSSAANYSTQFKNQFSCKVIWKYLTVWKACLCLSRGLWIKQEIDHLKALAILHMQRTLCPSPAQAEHKTSKKLHRNQSSSEDMAALGTPAGFAPTAFAAVH